MAPPRVLLVAFSIHGMIKPALVLAQRLAAIGAEVTFVTTIHAQRRIVSPLLAPKGVSFEPFSDGYDDDFDPTTLDLDLYDSETFRRGTQALSDLITMESKSGKPFSCVIHTPVVTWAAHVAAEFNLPAVLLWVQAATSFVVGHSYFHIHSCREIIDRCFSNKDGLSKTLPELRFLGLPFDLTVGDLPNYMDISSPQACYAKYHQQVFERLAPERHDTNERNVLVNTVEALETEALQALRSEKLNLIGIGPLADFGMPPSKDESYLKWMNSKPNGSVVYVSFGSLSVLAKPQMEEMAKALRVFGRPFVWVIRDGEKPSFGEELEKLGVIVEWCNQVEVLRSEALACFVSHCGWNSTLESLVCGVPMVAFPQRIDQLTNAKLVQDYWKVGVRVNVDEASGMVESEEIKKCLELVVEGEEFRSNANKWKGSAREAAEEGGSSDINLRAFVDLLAVGCRGQ